MLVATIVGGISLGFMYGLVALTLILLVRTTGVLNFAAADTGMIGAFVAYTAVTILKVPIYLAVLLVILFAVVFGAVIYGVVIRLRGSDSLSLSLRTLALLLLLNASAQKIWGADSPYTLPKFMPESTIDILGMGLSMAQLSVIFFAIVIAIAVAYITNRTRIGLLLRAVSADREAAAELGVSVIRVDLLAWCVSTAISCMVGILVAQINYLSPDMMAPILLAGFAAAQLADMKSTVIALSAGVLLGVIQSTSSVYLNEPEWSQIISFLILAIGLLARSRLTRGVATT